MVKSIRKNKAKAAPKNDEEEAKALLNEGKISKTVYDHMVKSIRKNKARGPKEEQKSELTAKEALEKIKSKRVKCTVSGNITGVSASNGTINIGSRKPVLFAKEICYENPKKGDLVKVTVYENTYRAIEVRRDIEREELKKAAEEMYEITDGAITLDPKGLDAKTVTKILLKSKSIMNTIRVQRKKLVQKKLRALRNAQKAQISFLVDCTGSMQSYITAVKDGIRKIRDSILKAKPGSEIEFAFVGYRDYSDEEVPLMNFSKDPKVFESQIESLIASGGGDEAEDVFSGLKRTSEELKWNVQIPSKFCFFIADAPSHGTFFAGSTSFNDDYPDFDSDGTKTKAVLTKLCRDGVKIISLRVNSRIDEMIKTYNELLGVNDGIATWELSDSNDMKSFYDYISKTTIDSITASVEMASSAPKLSRAKAHKEIRSMISRASGTGKSKTISSEKKTKAETKWGVKGKFTGSFAPTFSAITEEDTLSKSERFEAIQNVETYEIEKPGALLDLHKVPRMKDAGSDKYRFDLEEINKGGCRSISLCFHYETKEETSQRILKKYIDYTSTVDELSCMRCDLQCQAVAGYLAKSFSSLPVISKKIEYLDATGIRFVDKEDRIRYGCVENVLEGDYLKWSNNFSYVRGSTDEDFSATLQAFSHWTHSVTNGYLMIIDVQGVKNSENRFTLTDPAIHCTDEARFGDSNIGSEGMEEFFKHHECNQICKALKLKKHAASNLPSVIAGTPAVHS